MKLRKILFGSIVAGMVAYLCSLGFAGIDGSAHDFAPLGWMSQNEICLPCHTPHNGSLTVTDAPLWNHAVTTATFTVYTGPGTLDATVGQPSGVSKLCLSCHDGTVALDSYGGVTGSTNISGNANLGTNLSNDHPISFTYDATLATTDGELFNPTTTLSGLGSTITNDMLFSNKLECASCHDPHDSAGVTNMLLKSNADSALCLTCHDK